MSDSLQHHELQHARPPCPSDVVSEELKKGSKVQLVGFGTFEISQRAAREGRNPQTGDAMEIQASRTPKFKAGKALKDLVNGKK